jgi:hypothetical protein
VSVRKAERYHVVAEISSLRFQDQIELRLSTARFERLTRNAVSLLKSHPCSAIEDYIRARGTGALYGRGPGALVRCRVIVDEHPTESIHIIAVPFFCAR